MPTKTGVIYLQKEKFQIFSPYLPTILEFRFVPELIRDFDLVNRELLENLLKVFIVNNKVPASGLVIVIADNASFIQDFTSPSPQNPQQANTPPPTLEDLQNQANQYIEQVPFESVAGKTFPLATGIRAYATNQDVYEGFKSVLEKQGFIIEGVFPGFAFGTEISSKPVMDGNTVTLILQKLSMLREYNLLKETPTIAEATTSEEVEEKPQQPALPEKNKRFIIIGAIVGISLVLGITAFVLYSQFANPPYTPPPVTSGSPPGSGAATQTEPTQATAPVVADAKDLTVQILNASSSATTAETVKTAFSSYGFKTVNLQTQDSLGTAQPLLIFSPKVNAQLKTSVTESVKKVLGEVLVQEKTDSSFDIVVILGK